jgi:small subunit ribosomal protein S1
MTDNKDLAAIKANQESLEKEFSEFMKTPFVITGNKEIKKAVVVDVLRNMVLVDVGLKSEGFVPIEEFKDADGTIKVEKGDKTEVFVDSLDTDGSGNIKLSRDKVLQTKSWDVVQEAFEKSTIIEGTIFGRVRGGFIVTISHVNAFLPGSQVDVRPIKDMSALISEPQKFKVLKIDPVRGNIVVSRRAVLEESHKVEVDKVLATIKEGQILDGIVKNITNYGAFVDLGTIDGLVHIADISWSRISHPSEVLTIGQKIKVKVTKYDPVSKQVSLGIKQLERDPWLKIAEKYTDDGNVFKGAVTNITDYGIFVGLEKGVEGLVHVSEMSWSKIDVESIKSYNLGQDVEVVILEIDPEKHRISLSMKRCTENPWINFAENNKVGDILEVEVVNKFDYGFFVNLIDGIDGFVHVSDVAWTGDVKEIAKKIEVGSKVKVKILELEVEKEKVSVGMKQLEKDSFEDVKKLADKDGRITCVVKEVKSDGIVVNICEGVDSFIKRVDLSKDKKDQNAARFAPKERIDAKIVNCDDSNRKVTLSIKALEEMDERVAIKEYGSIDSGASLGDVLGSTLDSVSNKVKASSQVKDDDKSKKDKKDKESKK